MNQLAQQGLVIIEGRATYERIVTYIREVDAEEAVRQLQNFLKIYPEYAQAHNDIAVRYYQAGNGMKALAHYEKAHRLEPSNITYRKNLADFYFVELEWADDAIQTYLDILKDNPFDVETLNALGTINAQSGRREQARQFFTRTLQLDTVNSQARQALQLLGGQPPLAQQQMQIDQKRYHSTPPAPQPVASPVLVTPIFHEPPKNPEQLHRQAMELANAGNNIEALRLLEEIVLCYPNYAVAHNDLGVLYQQEGNLGQARLHQEEAFRLQPDNLTFQKNLADLLFIAFGETEAALELYVKILGNNPRDIETLRALSDICLETGKLNDARAFLETILKIEPWDSEAREALASVSDQELNMGSSFPFGDFSVDEIYTYILTLLQQERLSEAHSLLEKLVHNNSGNALFHNDLGVLRYRLGDIDGARRSYERAVELLPTNSTFRKNQADLYFTKLDMIDDAIGIYLDLLRLQPGDSETLTGLGQICAAVGRPDEARSFYRRALEIEPGNGEIRSALQALN